MAIGAQNVYSHPSEGIGGVGLSNEAIHSRVMPLVGSAVLCTAAGSYFLQGWSFWPILVVNLIAFFASYFTYRIPVVGPLVFYTFAFFEGGLLIPLLKLASVTIQPAGVAVCFLVASTIFFGVMAVGMVTKKDFSFLGSFLGFSLLAIILFQVANLFFNFMTAGMGAVMSVSLIGLMVGFTLYDISRIKREFTDDMAVMAAMSLYLNFIIMFQEVVKLAIYLFGNNDRD